MSFGPRPVPDRIISYLLPARRSSVPKRQLFSRTTVRLDKGEPPQIHRLTAQALTLTPKR
jgi:hypothetical protein